MDIEVTCFVSNDDETASIGTEDVEQILADQPDALSPVYSVHEPCKRFMFIEWPAGWCREQVNADRRLVGVCLSGHVLFEASDGTKSDCRAGDVWRLRDTGISDLKATVIGDQSATFLIVHID